ncbi:hypothetical protein BZA05DRAFT_425160 [Tricharina praecox]|uniref:uncharacterized protein n=1 Tax=Tricharina praecox TaxID=43433 RepID=UPI00221FDCF9|nr:uncharacterized protein BZA05DRAFT_425160 [Tricharina praecox]KAI5853796.1 hypothetical protein BZA05DRAFT_425160 [Tricharina praecox]
MPVQVSRQHQPQPHHSNHSSTSLNNAATSSYSLHRESPASSRDDASSTSSLSINKGNGEDGRQRKRLQKTAESTTLPRKSSLREPRSGSADGGVLFLANRDTHGRTLAPTSSSSATSTNADAHTNALKYSGNPDETDSTKVTTFYAFGESKLKGEGDLDDPFDFQPSMNLEDVNAFHPPSRKVSGSSIRSIRAGVAGAGSQDATSSMLRRPSVGKFSSPRNPDRNSQEAAPRRRQSNITNLALANPASNSIAAQRRKPSCTVPGSTGPPVPPKYHKMGGYSEATAEGGVKVPISARSGKSKSLQPPPRPIQPQINTSLAPDGYRASIGIPPKSPRSPNTSKKVGTPGPLALRRISTIPHASGLAARTISPTDARRLKRLSMLNTPPPPVLPPPVEPSRSTQASPSMIPRKSVTPSSQGTTPEPQRKSYSSGLSASSASTSARTSVGSLQPKVTLNYGSRLPRPPQLERDDEEIPPVPPLPKNLATFFAPRKSSLAPETLGQPEPADEPEIFDLEAFEPTHISQEIRNLEPRAEKRESRRKRGMTLGGLGPGSAGFPMLETKASASSLRKKDLAPIRLPPLNLLPLSTPTVARVNAYLPTSDSDKELTPPPKIGHKTPSTPMTASKAAFFNRREEGGQSDRDRIARERSISSPSSLSLRTGSSPTSSIPTASPYVSGSLPRGTSAGATPRVKSRSRKSQDSLKNAPAEELSGSPSTSSSIRRKLSLSWKKSSQGKNSHAATERAEEYNAKFDNMPPPRLPTSSTWTNTPSPNKGPHIAAAGKRKGSVGGGPFHDRTRSDSWGTAGSPKKEKKSDEKVPALQSKASSAASSILSPMTKMLGSKGSLSQLRSRNQPPLPHNSDPTLDHDDLIAEDEMRRIASKRKNLDQAAAQLDELKRRAGPKDRVSTQQILRMGVLNIFEKGEVVDYKDVYFTGLSDARKHVGDLKNTTLPNFGYDDERGDYTIVKGDHLAYRYEIVDVLGKGSFGQVVRCIDHRTGGLVAIKIIRNKKRFHQQALVEVNILQKLKEWDPNQKHSLINFTQSFYFRGHLCISTELLGMNLYEFIKSNDFRGFSLKLIRRFTKQMLSSLTLLKGHRVIHCDLKPENILLAHPARSEIKVIDFGSSCFENEKVYTYIQSRFYRSPEVILGMSYGLPIDMWSLGCILAELFTGYPIFPGENEQEQLACIMEVFGPPEKHLIEKSTRRKLFFDSQGKPRMIVSSKGRRRRVSSKTLQQVLKCDDEPFLDFVSRCLRWDPDKRLRPEEAMSHEFISGRKPPVQSRARSGNYASGTASSDTRRYTAYSRPLPDPPTTAKKVTVACGNHSPMKTTPSTNVLSSSRSITGKNPILAAGTKRNSTGATRLDKATDPSAAKQPTAAAEAVQDRRPTTTTTLVDEVAPANVLAPEHRAALGCCETTMAACLAAARVAAEDRAEAEAEERVR